MFLFTFNEVSDNFFRCQVVAATEEEARAALKKEHPTDTFKLTSKTEPGVVLTEIE